MDQITNPHDKFFKEVFTRKDAAEEFVRSYLPGGGVGGQRSWEAGDEG